ncbi:MAG: ABC transporter permease [Devosia sp.]|jgi:peptide/nickel transport system permease protein|uniref:ABC transporter permease n=1 Tax=Devosia sp. TaxID=1871048 RepID=UPI001A4AC761|nr:ABC transporter permease [Devosia sp.]MBL8596406.1 ABC transporter permease [Devosia sp.]
MIRFALTKFLGLAATLLVAAAITFAALDILPGDPARFILGINATPDAVAALREQLGLDAPALQRFFSWIGGMFVGDFGLSYTQGQPVGQLIAGRLGVTIPLTVIAMILSAGIGLPIGILAARRRGSFADTGLMVLAQLGVAIPNFWFGMLLVLLFSVTLRWLPPGGFVPWGENPFAAFASLILPSIALALPQAAILARVMRTALVDVQGSDYIRTARAKGLTLSEAVWKHGVRNAMLPVLTILGLQFAYLVAGTVIVENVFYLPGLGRLIFDAISARDLILVRSSVIILVLAVIGTMFLTDLAYAWVDPRLRSRKAE